MHQLKRMHWSQLIQWCRGMRTHKIGSPQRAARRMLHDWRWRRPGANAVGAIPGTPAAALGGAFSEAGEVACQVSTGESVCPSATEESSVQEETKRSILPPSMRWAASSRWLPPNTKKQRRTDSQLQAHGASCNPSRTHRFNVSWGVHVQGLVVSSSPTGTTVSCVQQQCSTSTQLRSINTVAR